MEIEYSWLAEDIFSSENELPEEVKSATERFIDSTSFQNVRKIIANTKLQIVSKMVLIGYLKEYAAKKEKRSIIWPRFCKVSMFVKSILELSAELDLISFSEALDFIEKQKKPDKLKDAIKTKHFSQSTEDCLTKFLAKEDKIIYWVTIQRTAPEAIDYFKNSTNLNLKKYEGDENHQDLLVLKHFLELSKESQDIILKKLENNRIIRENVSLYMNNEYDKIRANLNNEKVASAFKSLELQMIETTEYMKEEKLNLENEKIAFIEIAARLATYLNECYFEKGLCLFCSQKESQDNNLICVFKYNVYYNCHLNCLIMQWKASKEVFTKVYIDGDISRVIEEAVKFKENKDYTLKKGSIYTVIAYLKSLIFSEQIYMASQNQCVLCHKAIHGINKMTSPCKRSECSGYYIHKDCFNKMKNLFEKQGGVQFRMCCPFCGTNFDNNWLFSNYFKASVWSIKDIQELTQRFGKFDKKNILTNLEHNLFYTRMKFGFYYLCNTQRHEYSIPMIDEHVIIQKKKLNYMKDMDIIKELEKLKKTTDLNELKKFWCSYMSRKSVPKKYMPSVSCIKCLKKAQLMPMSCKHEICTNCCTKICLICLEENKIKYEYTYEINEDCSII